MRHWMEDPDNENRLLKIPPRVVQGIKAEALDEAVQRVEAYLTECGITMGAPVVIGIRTAIKGEQ